MCSRLFQTNEEWSVVIFVVGVESFPPAVVGFLAKCSGFMTEEYVEDCRRERYREEERERKVND